MRLEAESPVERLRAGGSEESDERLLGCVGAEPVDERVDDPRSESVPLVIGKDGDVLDVEVDRAVTVSNREIAQALFVTPRTVEMHLSNSFRKLGIASRTQLAGALAARSTEAVA